MADLLLANALVKVITDASGVRAGLADVEKSVYRALSGEGKKPEA